MWYFHFHICINCYPHQTSRLLSSRKGKAGINTFQLLLTGSSISMGRHSYTAGGRSPRYLEGGRTSIKLSNFLNGSSVLRIWYQRSRTQACHVPPFSTNPTRTDQGLQPGSKPQHLLRCTNIASRSRLPRHIRCTFSSNTSTLFGLGLPPYGPVSLLHCCTAYMLLFPILIFVSHSCPFYSSNVLKCYIFLPSIMYTKFK
jgi:hypothetical protein